MGFPKVLAVSPAERVQAHSSPQGKDALKKKKLHNQERVTHLNMLRFDEALS